ncbi:chaperonin groEL [Cellulophaga phage phi14:2]|uniref:Chaperonin GroEL n=1 Tax=Cellulophaga phage phi14:2 TaxID=1327990 RepID=S0A2G6_9CAUD|nr:chaperonin groEL [Cellulophaga phage phi14:2]AGO48995.1 chaperonin GroEL [Cellulophaga phage phi14:2]
MTKKIIYNQESREALKRGVDALANAVKVTLGPSGKNVILGLDQYNPIITKDGVSVAREIHLEDPFENLGAQMIKQVAENTNTEVGDGTTTATVLAQKILEEGFKAIEEGRDVNELVDHLRNELISIVARIKEATTEVKNNDDIKNVALISTNGDEVLSTIIVDCYKEVKDNIIFEESKTNITYKEIVKGMRFNSSYISTYFINDSETATVKYDDGLIFVFDGKIESVKDISNVLYAAEKYKKPLVIIAESVDDNTIINLVQNTKKGLLKSVVIQSPGFGFGRQKALKDIAVYTGGDIYNAKSKLDTIKFGKFDSITVTEDNTVIKGMYGDEKDIEARITELEFSKKEKNTYEISKIEERISKFKNGIGIIYIGANSRVEMKERKDRLEDAINAVKAAVEEGIVPGGGSTLAKIALTHYGNDIYYGILFEPYKQIEINKGKVIDSVVSYDLTQPAKYFKQGIIDPSKVTRTALENAVSIASTILTTECAIV